MNLRIAFLHTRDERLLVLSETVRLASTGKKGSQDFPFSLTVFDHENTFLKLAATAELPIPVTISIISDVLLSVSQPVFPHRWLDIDITESDFTTLGLHAESVNAGYVTDDLAYEEIEHEEIEPEEIHEVERSFFGFNDDGEQFYEFLAQAPTPFVMLTGPEHRMSFINPPYARLLGRVNQDSLIGKPVREALPDLEGQPFFALLDKVYRTGEQFIGTEVPIRLKSEATGEYQNCFVDFIYHPVRDVSGKVQGIMIQAAEVTDRVLSREVANSREHQLYNQWLELEAIYKTAPLGVILFDAKNLTILRINDTQAEFLGRPSSELVGKGIEDIAWKLPEYKDLLERVVSGEVVRNALIEASRDTDQDLQRRWLLNITPFRNSIGIIEKLCSISLEIPQAILPSSPFGSPLPSAT